MLLLTACPKEPEVIPGDVKDVGLIVKLADLQQSELDTIGSFNLTLIHNGDVEREVALSFSSSSRTLAFLDEPADLPTTGTLSAIFEARDVLGQPIDIGGRTGTVDLDALDGDDGDLVSTTMFGVVSRVGRAAPLGVTNRAGTSVRAVGVGSGVLVIGDSGVQWIDLASGEDCLSTATNDECGFDEALPADGNDVVMTELSAFDADCPQRTSALITRGNEAWLFQPFVAVLTKLALSLQPRANGLLVPTRDCRVLVAGGGSSTDFVSFADGDDVANITAEPGPPIGFALADGAAAATGNALGEVLVIGEGGAAVVRTAGDVAVCSLGDDGCNGEVAEPVCVRAEPLAARVDDDGDLSPVLIFGGDCAEPEVFRSAAVAPFGGFLAVGAPPVPRRDGATLTPISGGALLAGGIDLESGTVTRAASFFRIDSLSATAASGTWESLGDLASPEGRARHAAAVVGGAVVIVGGFGEVGDDLGIEIVPIEVVVPAASLSRNGGGT